MEDQPEQAIYSTVPRDIETLPGCLISEVNDSRLANRQLTCGFEGNHIKNLSTLLGCSNLLQQPKQLPKLHLTHKSLNLLLEQMRKKFI